MFEHQKYNLKAEWPNHIVSLAQDNNPISHKRFKIIPLYSLINTI